jgi:predicted dehydrogenase
MDVMASELSPDVAAIATPSALHAEQAVYWMERGAHIVLEKPVALSTAAMERIAEAQRQFDRKIAVAYVLRYSPHIRLLARAAEAGRFGRIFHVGLNVYWNRNDHYYTQAPWRGTWAHDGGTLMNQATHGIDLLQWLVGDSPSWVHGTLSRFMRPIEADDFASATIGFAKGAVGTVNVTVNTYPENLGTRLTILGETGTVELSGNGPDAVSTWRFPPEPEWDGIDQEIRAGEWNRNGDTKTGHAAVYEDLHKAVVNGGHPVANLTSSRVSTEIVLGIQKSHRSGATVEFPLTFSTEEMLEATV